MAMHRALGGGRFLMSEVPLYSVSAWILQAVKDLCYMICVYISRWV